MYKSVVVSSGHGKYVSGAVGILNEVEEARKVTEQVATELRNRNVAVKTFHDNTSKSQSENLNTIIAYHNKQQRDLDVSVHFNAYVETDKGMGVECLYKTQHDLSAQISSAIAGVSGLINRGPKKRDDLAFLNSTQKPAILIETAFVDSSTDADLYRKSFAKICDSIADVLGGVEAAAPVTPPEAVQARVSISIGIEGDVEVIVNGQVIEIVGHGR